MKKALFILMFLFVCNYTFSQNGKSSGAQYRPLDGDLATDILRQENPCDLLANKIYAYGALVDVITTDEVDWMKKITIYKYGEQFYAIASLKKNKRRFKSYLYCGIPLSNLNNLKENNLMDLGKGFNQFIKPYKCNCY